MPFSRQNSQSLEAIQKLTEKLDDLTALSPKTDSAIWQKYCALKALRVDINAMRDNKYFEKKIKLVDLLSHSVDALINSLIVTHPGLNNRIFFDDMSFDELNAISKQIQLLKNDQTLQVNDLIISKLDAKNIPLYKVTRQDPLRPAVSHTVVIRFIDDQKLIDSKQQLKSTLAAKHLAQQYVCKPVEYLDDQHVHTYMEITEFFQQGDLARTMRKLHETMEPVHTQRVATGYVRNLIEIMLDFEAAGVCFADIKPSNFMVTDNNHLAISDTKSLFLTNGKTVVKTKGNIIDTAGYRAPEQFIRRTVQDVLFKSDDCDIRKNAREILDEDKTNIQDIHRYMIGLSIYEIVTNHLIASEDRTDTGEHRFNFEHPAFNGPEGNVLRNIIIGLTNPIAQLRISFADANQLLIEFHGLVRTSSLFFHNTPPAVIRPKPARFSNAEPVEMDLDKLMEAERANLHSPVKRFY